LPSIGIFITVVWSADKFFSKWRLPSIAIVMVTSLILFACAVRTMDQLRYWQNSETLYAHAVSVTKNNWIAHYNLGYELLQRGRIDEALFHYRIAVQTQSRDVDSLNSYGFALTKKGDYENALPYFEKALQLKPSFHQLHYNIANALLHLNRFDDAREHFETFLQYHSNYVAALNGNGITLGVSGDTEKAIVQFETALRLEPNNPDTHFNLAEALIARGQNVRAKEQLTEALRLRPGWTQAENELRKLTSDSN
jgi:tetratricopeptide (TPR) repeat protein